jgi:alpha-D-ribose 1-methylphosphonate 5-triphosphate synthase subunit PhnH
MQACIESKINQTFIVQDTFRKMLDSLARPGKVNQLPNPGFTPPTGLNTYLALILITLLDGETTFSVCPEHVSWIDYIQINTGANLTDISSAEYVVADGMSELPELAFISQGDLVSPERGATLLFQVGEIKTIGRGGDIKIILQGPGIETIREFYVSGMSAAHWSLVQQLNGEFPLGTDLFLVSEDGKIAGIPRSSKLAWEVQN